MIDTDKVIVEHITHRNESLFKPDMMRHHGELQAEISGKSVMVIGGAGTIGSAYIKALLAFEPARLYVVDTNENGLTELTRDLRSTYGLRVPKYYKAYPIDFGDAIFDRILKNEGPFDVIANFAAHKHVRSEKDGYSIRALINNNVLRAERLLSRLVECPPQHFFCVSTDKAANPVNIMGASKRIMEQVVLAYSAAFSVSTARFANVAFSQGSLLDGFVYRVAKRQPLSAPCDVQRYFVSPEESGHICLLACMLGASGDIFFPKLQEDQMMTFSDIATRFLVAQGLNPRLCSSEEEAKRVAAEGNGIAQAYPVYYFQSDTSGEKAFEEFVAENEEIDLESFESLGVIKKSPGRSMVEIQDFIASLSELLTRDHLAKKDIVEVLEAFIPTFKHVETGRNLDQKM